jgi:hypothetical protein
MIQLETYGPGQKRQRMQQWNWTKYDYTILTGFTGQIRDQWNFFVSIILNVRDTWRDRYFLFSEKTLASQEQMFVMELGLWFWNKQRLLFCKNLSFREIAKDDFWRYHVCPSVSLFAWDNSPITERIFVTLNIWIFFENPSLKFKFH